MQGWKADPARHRLPRRSALAGPVVNNPYRGFSVLMEGASLWKVDAIEAAPGAVVGLDRVP